MNREIADEAALSSEKTRLLPNLDLIAEIRRRAAAVPPLDGLVVEAEGHPVDDDHRSAFVQTQQPRILRRGRAHREGLLRPGHDLAAEPLVGGVKQVADLARSRLQQRAE